MDLVKIIIPIYKATFSQEEKIALSRAYEILNAYPIVVVKPETLDLSALMREFPKIAYENFPEHYFAGISGYNRLMLSTAFYERFLSCDYILIYQLDAYVFRDELKEWCEKGYDYVGAPWLQRPVYRFPLISQVMRLRYLYQKRKGLPSKQDLYDNVGNGGLSLRKVESHHRVTLEQRERICFFLSQRHYHLYNEDVFWATEANGFSYPDSLEALRFSFDKYPAYCYWLNKRQMPFGCHAWYKRKMRGFWKRFIPFQL